MELYFSSPIALVAAYGIFSDNLTKSIFVLPHNRGMPGTRFNSELIRQFQKISQITARSLGIEYSEIEFHDYLRLKPDVIESSLACNLNNARNIIINGSDSYCIFGFGNYFRYVRTKIKLQRLFRNNFKVHSGAKLYSYNQYPENLKSPNEGINQSRVIQLLNRVAPNIFEGLGQNIESIVNEECILVLPPIYKYTGENFTLRFLQRVESMAKERDLKVFIKPHRNDDMNYSSFFTDKRLLLGEKLDFKFVPVEFFFTLKHVVYIMAVPSSSLALTGGIRTQVLVPKNRRLFRRSFLDQLPFLHSIGLKFEKI